MSAHTIKAARTRVRVARRAIARVDSRIQAPKLIMMDWFRRKTVSGVLGR